MWASQHFVTVLANTIQPTDHSTSTFAPVFDKPLPATPFTESDPDITCFHTMNAKELPSHPQLTFPLDQEPIVIAVIGQRFIGKSCMIQYGFPQGFSYQLRNISTGIRQHSYMVQIHREPIPRRVIFLEMDHMLKDDDLAMSIHAALICYDVTQRLSMNGVPDLLSLYHSQQLPTYLLGLNSDSASIRQVDYTFGEQLAQRFGVPFYEMKTNDIFTAHHMFMNLLRQCINMNNNRTNSSSPVICQPTTTTPPATTPVVNDDDDTNIKMASSTTMIDVVNQQHPVENNNNHHDDNQVRHLHHHQRMPPMTSKSEHNAALPADLASGDPAVDDNAIWPYLGFVYAPTTTTIATNTTAVAAAAADADVSTTTHDLPMATPPFDSPHDKPLSSSSTDNFPRYRRGSKDSGDSLGTGLSVDAIIDRLTTPGMGRSDELMTPIFIIFFRKFMSPYELVQVLIRRFENDLCMPSIPTPLQQKVTSVLISWMTDYWSDFYHRQTRNQLHLFLGRLSALLLSTTLSTSSLQSLLEKLYPLSLQPVPNFDPDDTWGRKDIDTLAIDHSKKKDSGYISSYLGASYSSLMPESLASDVQPLGDYIWSRQSSATGLAAFPATHHSSPLPPQQRPANHSSSSMTTSAKLYTSSSLLDPPVATPDYFSGSISTPIIPPATPTSRIHVSPSISSPPSPPNTSSGSTTPASVTNSGCKNKTLMQTTDKTDRTTTATSSPSSSSSNASLTRPEFAGGLIQFVSPMPQASFPANSIGTSATTVLQPMTGPKCRSRSPNTFAMKISPSPPLNHRPYYPTGFAAPQSPFSTMTAPLDADIYGSNISAGYMHQPVTNQQQQHQQPATMAPLSTQPSIDPHSVKSNTKFFLSISNQEMAEQLTWIDAELFRKIKSREFVRMIWANNDTAATTTLPRQSKRPNSMASFSSEEQDDLHSIDQSAVRTKSGLLASISHWNFLSALVTSMIVTQAKLGKRVALLEKFMTIAVALRDLNNYNSLMAILAGVNNAAILRMKHTQEAIKKKKIYKRFQSLEKLMSSDRSYASYRIALKAHTTCPSIPYLGILSQDLIALDEANKNMKSDGTIHWDKFRLMGDSIMTIIKFQQQRPSDNIMPDKAVLNWIANCRILSEEEQYTQSMKNEPRLKAKSTTRLRDLWFRI
ncbi:ras guanine nucleotide exchange factor domain-containing protein [Absidia repens]|uniref:Ras guanine nucleotide exchange factor domain-containing protein n=1 Tax=Absidia repens TaxID=90262 RepID=A0A1X2IXB3_9FUNG|nr:ras guanine nucleotide exchange factor domain-containing protein [Absidia repens]